jgi:hypothetical protein
VVSLPRLRQDYLDIIFSLNDSHYSSNEELPFCIPGIIGVQLVENSGGLEDLPDNVITAKKFFYISI